MQREQICVLKISEQIGARYGTPKAMVVTDKYNETEKKLSRDTIK